MLNIWKCTVIITFVSDKPSNQIRLTFDKKSLHLEYGVQNLVTLMREFNESKLPVYKNKTIMPADEDDSCSDSDSESPNAAVSSQMSEAQNSTDNEDSDNQVVTAVHQPSPTLVVFSQLIVK